MVKTTMSSSMICPVNMATAAGTDDHGKNETIDGAANCHNLHENLRQDTK